MMPFGGTRVVPAGWSKHHQPTASGGMNATAKVYDPARTTPGAFDPNTGTNGAPTLHYVVSTATACRVQALNDEHPSTQAGQPSTTRDYLVQFTDPALATFPDMQVGYVVVIEAAGNDATLVGVELAIRDVQRGSERFTRDVIATHNQQPG